MKDSWFDILSADITVLAEKLARKAEQERNNGTVIYPSQEDIFRALKLTPPDKLKVCVVGQVILSPLPISSLSTRVEQLYGVFST